MRKSEKIIFITELFLFLIFFLSFFVTNIFNNYIMFLLLGIVTFIIYLFIGYEKDKNIYKKNLTYFITFYAVAFIIIMYGVGLVFGYVKSPFKLDVFSIIKNIFPIALVIISSEFLRYLICKKSSKNKLILICTIFVFILIDLVLNKNYYDLTDFGGILKYVTIVILPSIFKNTMLTSFAHKYGLIQNIVYRLIIELYVYILPFTPDLGIYLQSVLMMIFPVFLMINIKDRFDKKEKIDYRNKGTAKKIVKIVVICITLIIVGLNSNLFRYWTAVIGSGSMEPTINIGDVVVVDKIYQKNLDKLENGDVLVFKIGEKIYTHRIISLEVTGDNYYIKTKGDRKGNIEDNWVVTNKDVIGVVKFKINYIGYPTVWLSRILEG